MKLTGFYYDFVVGEYPDNSTYLINTSLVLNYLIDAGLTEVEVSKLIIEELPNKDYLEFKDIPNIAWNNSLLNKDTFYYHKELQIVSPPPTWDKSFPFFLEMKIKYTTEDILNYFVSVFNIRTEWINREKEIGSINYLLKKYSMFQFMQPVDFILHLIDYTKSLGIKAVKIYDICDYEIQLAELLEIDVKQSIANNKNNIVWRS